MKDKQAQKNQCAIKTSIGGQALMEGIMMRGPKKTALAVRNPEGKIVLEEFETKGAKRPKICRWPIIRGLFAYFDSMTVGYRCLMRSAEIAGLEDAVEESPKKKKKREEREAAERAKTAALQTEPADGEAQTSPGASDPAGTPAEESVIPAVQTADPSAKPEPEEQPSSLTDPDTADAKKEGKEEKEGKDGKNGKEEKKLPAWVMTLTMVGSVVLGMGLAIALFIMVPTFLFNLLAMGIPVLKDTGNIALDSFCKSAIEGVIRIIMLVGYMGAISLMKDIRRTFMFHGAEHKTIFCYEAGLDLTVENIRKQRRFHPRCGTSFLILMLLVGIFISFFIDPISIWISGHTLQTGWRFLAKFLLLPLVVGIGYELIKLAGRHDNLFTRIISAPGLWLQRVTVFEPTDDMIECAIMAMKDVIPDDGSDKW